MDDGTKPTAVAVGPCSAKKFRRGLRQRLDHRHPRSPLPTRGVVTAAAVGIVSGIAIGNNTMRSIGVQNDGRGSIGARSSSTGLRLGPRHCERRGTRIAAADGHEGQVGGLLGGQ